jgi:hypothetical protein
MPKQISISIGFVTNSSSVVHHFPRELLNHPKVKTFIEKFELQDGFVGDNLWHRDRCGSFLVSADQKAEVARNFSGDNSLSDDDYQCKGPAIDMDPDQVVLIYGDEYGSIASSLCSLLIEALCEKAGPEARWGHSNSYN